MNMEKFLSSRLVLPVDLDDTHICEKDLNARESTWFERCKKGVAASRARRVAHITLSSRFIVHKNKSMPAAALVAIVLALVYLVAKHVIVVVVGHDVRSINLPSVSRPPAVRELSSKYDKPFVLGCVDPDTSQPRANAVLVVLARNSELPGVLQSVASLERHFNRWFQYPYVFLNDEPFDAHFKAAIRNVTSSSAQFGVIDPRDWNFPAWADPEEVDEAIAKQGDLAIMYGGMASYHRMCRFYSGKFFDHPLIKPYDWYWRVEPDVKYFCDITYDPFVEMQKNDKVYGFTIVIKELVETVPNLFRHTVAFKRAHNVSSTRAWSLFLEKESASSTNNPNFMNKQVYNMCHFWSNFEIARLDFFRSKQYQDYFHALDKSEGFWRERWGDAPVHSLAAGLFLEPEQLHYFRDIGYKHTTIQHCPANAPQRQLPHVPYIRDPLDKRQVKDDAYWADPDPVAQNGVGCRCRCDTDVVDYEGKEGSCFSEWADLIGGFVQ